jgi:site-specific DNA-methyltransferase (adenine-specific)
MNKHSFDILRSKKSDHWETPKDFYRKINKEYKFTFDPCPLYSKRDGLKISWGKRCFVNPPYSNIPAFLEKAKMELAKKTELVVFFIPSRTDTRWFHKYIYKKCKIIFLKGRFRFSNNKNCAPFPSMLVVMK